MKYPKLWNGPSPVGEALVRALQQTGSPFLSAATADGVYAGTMDGKSEVKKTGQLRYPFVATPSSQSHVAGYLPPDVAPEIFKVTRAWPNWKGRRQPPTSLKGWSDIDQRPGNVTWYSDQIKDGRVPVVVSWRGDASRHTSTFGGLGQTYGTLSGQACHGFVFDADRWQRASTVWINAVAYAVGVSVDSAALTRTEAGVKLRVMSGNTLYESADPVQWRGRRKREEAVVLPMVEIGQPGVLVDFYQAPFFNASGDKVLFLGEYYDGEVEANRTVLVEWDTATGAHSFVHKGVYEEVGAYTATVAQDTNYDEEIVGGVATSVSNSGTITKTVVVETPRSAVETVVIAADYRGDELVYVLHEYTWPLDLSVGTDTAVTSFSASTTATPGAEPDTWDVSGTKSISGSRSTTRVAPAGIRLIHSTLGVLYQRSCGRSSEYTATFDGSWSVLPGEAEESEFSGSYEYEEEYEDLGSPACGFLACADLRVDTLLCGASASAYFYSRQDESGSVTAVSGSFGVAGTPGVEYPMAGFLADSSSGVYTLSRAGSIFSITNREDYVDLVAWVFGERVEALDFSGCVDPGPPAVTNAISGTINTNYVGDFPGATAVTALPGDLLFPAYDILSADATYSVAPVFSQTVARKVTPMYEIPPSTSPSEWQYKLFRYARCAFSPDGKVGYIGYESFDAYGDPFRKTDNGLPGPERKRVECFVFKTAGGVQVVDLLDPPHALVNNAYAPGDGSTLAGAVFLGAVKQ